MACIFVRKGNEAGKVFPLPDGKTRFVIGRRPGVDVLISDPKASRDHAEIELSGNQFIARDLASRNGTRLNGEELSSATPLHEGSLIAIGQTVMEFSLKVEEEKADFNISGYEMASRVGRGKMGSVYIAKQVSMDRTVAIKVINPELGRNKAFAQSFVNDVRKAAGLMHNNLVRIYDAGSADGNLYYTMELIQGVTLASLIKTEGPLKPVQSIKLLLQLIDGVQYTHENNVVHGNISPAGILVTTDGKIKLADVGFVASAALRKNDEQPYLSPEQIDGQGASVRSDIYNLGMVFYQMMTGRYPAGGRPLDLPSIPESIFAILEKMMARNPEARYGSVDELATVIRGTLKSSKGAVAASAPAPAKVAKPKASKPKVSVKKVARKKQRKQRDAGIPGLKAIVTLGIVAIASFVVAEIASGPGRVRRSKSSFRADDVAMIETETIEVKNEAKDITAIKRANDLAEAAAKKAAEEAEARAKAEAANKPKEEPKRRAQSGLFFDFSDDGSGGGGDESWDSDVKAAEEEPMEVATGPAPDIKPELICSTYIGGKEDQSITSMKFMGPRIYMRGMGFSFTYDTENNKSTVSGDLNTPGIDSELTAGGGGEKLESMMVFIDTRDDTTYEYGAKRVSDILVQPFLGSSAEWTLWNADYRTASRAGMLEDAGVTGIWPITGGKLLVALWAFGEESMLVRDPKDPSKPAPFLSKENTVPMGPSTLLVIVNPKDGSIEGGRFLKNRMKNVIADPWGRIYIAQAIKTENSSPDEALGFNGDLGLTILSADLKTVLLNTKLGVATEGKSKEVMKTLVLRRGVLALGAVTDRTGMKTLNPSQPKHGGDLDIALFVIKLWDYTPPAE